MTGLRFRHDLYERLSGELFSDVTVESCAVVFTVPGGAQESWIVDEIVYPLSQDYLRSDLTGAALKPAFVVEIANRARKSRRGIVMVHTHPFEATYPGFSPIDDAGERELRKFFDRRAAHATHLALVMAPT